MARAMRRINSTSTGQFSATCAFALCLIVSACGEDDSTKKDATVYSLDFAVADAGGDTSGWTFQQDTSSDATSLDTVEPSVDVVIGDGLASADTDGLDATSGDGGPPDTGPVAITSCAGSCGINLEANACHCDHGCIARSDCCADFTAACSCETLSDCDDGNQCTSDKCATTSDGKKWCKQLPFFGCCNSDAACGTAGKNKCITPTCLQVTCSDVEKDCNDGVDCTIDACDPTTGDCSHKLSSTKCLIDGACHGAGASKPGSGGCVLCQPDKAPDAWTSKPGTCLIDGICSKSGEPASTSVGECRVCDPSKDTGTWSVASGACLIDGKCHLSGATSLANPNCASCQPSQSQTGWSGVSGKCAVGDKCYDTGAGDPAASCAVCDPTKSSATLTPKPGFCVIDGVCVATGASKPGAFGCQTCDTSKSVTAWTAKKVGTACADDDPCSIDTLCIADGLCKGKTEPNCCKSDADCVGKVNPEACEKVVCKGDGVCATQPDPSCCSAGVCCDIPAGKLKPLGTQCSTFSIGAEYKCEGGNGFKRKLFPGCTGKPEEANKCSQSQPASEAWQSYKVCSAGTSCFLSMKTSPPVCK